MTKQQATHPSLMRSASIVGLMTLLSRITGMFQSRMLAYYLGVGGAADAFFVAFRIPNLLRRFTAEGTMTAAFLPTISETEAQEGEKAAQDLVASFLGTLGIFMILVCTLGVLLMGLITGLQMIGRIAPGAAPAAQLAALGQVLMGHRTAPPDVALTTNLARIMFPYLGLVSLTAGLAAVLNLKGRFGLPASVSTFWNLSFMGFGYLCLHFGPASWRNPYAATFVFAAAMLVGGLVQLLMLWPSFRGLGYRMRWGFHLGHPGVRKALKRLVPGLLGTGVHPINVLISTILASQLALGAQTVLFNSNMMGELVLALFSASLATVSLPIMSRLVDAGDMKGLERNLASALRGTALLAIPSSVGLAVLAHPIIALIFQTGRFGKEGVAWTAWTMMFQTVGLLFIATSRITAQCLYALKDYKSPAYAAFIGIICNIVLSATLMRVWGTGGISLANGLSSMIGLGYLVWRLRNSMEEIPFKPVLGAWLSMGIASGFMGLLAWQGGRLVDVFSFHGVAGTSLRLFPLMGLCSVFYFLLLRIMRVPEAEDLLTLAKRKLGRS